MLQYLYYYIALLRIKFFSGRKNVSRYDYYTPYDRDPKITGVLESDLAWKDSCPSLAKSENLTLVTSNTFDKSAIKVTIKWRPDRESGLTSVLSQLSLEHNDSIYDHEEAQTYVPQNSTIQGEIFTQWGSSKSALKLFVLAPYRRYRIVFCGYMRNRCNPESERVLVKLNVIAYASTKPFDFREQFDESFVASQIAKKQPKCGLVTALNSLICHDRHEFLVQIKGEFVIGETKDKLFNWGFYSRQFVDDSTQKLRSKRVLGYFSRGKAMHLGIIESVDNNFDKNQQMYFGYDAEVGSVIPPLKEFNHDSLDWDKLTSDTRQIECSNFKATRRSAHSEFFDMQNDKKKGWMIFFINDAFDTAGDLRKISRCLEDYKLGLAEKQIMDQKISTALLGEPLVVNIYDQECLNSNPVGAKASSLAHLEAWKTVQGSNSFRVPAAVVMTRFAFDKLVAENEEAADKIRQFIDRVGQGSLKDLCQEIQQYFTSSDIKMPAHVEEALKEKLNSTFQTLDNRSFAVRSSSWGEDEEGMSAAGQLKTCLYVSGYENLINAVKTCFASKFSYTNIEYKRQHGMPLDMPMAVVIQEMIDCDKAGVIFTCDPKSGDSKYFTIIANYGAGESVVSDQGVPDSIMVNVLDGEPKIESKTIGSKEVIITSANFKAGPEPELQKIEPELQNIQPVQDITKCCMSDDEILQLSKCTLKLLKYFQSHRDIEFGFKNGSLYLFQARPVTGLNKFSDYEMLHEVDTLQRSEYDHVSRANIGEVMPYALTPMLISYSIPNWGVVGGRLFYKWRRVRKEEYAPYIPSGIRLQSYHFFFSLTDNELFLNTDQEGQKSVLARAQEIGLFGHELDEPELAESAREFFSVKKPLRFSKLFYDFDIMDHRFYPHTKIAKTKRFIERILADINAHRFVKNDSLEELFRQIALLTGLMYEPWRDHFANIFLGGSANVYALIFLSKYINDPTKLFVALSEILGSTPYVLSAEIPARIAKIADIIKKRGASEAETFATMSNKDAFKYITNDQSSDLAREFDVFMEKFGHRCYNEFELNKPSWRDNPDEIVEKIKQNALSKVSEPRHTKSIDEVIKSLNLDLSFKDRMLLKYYYIPTCQTHVSAREKTKDNLIRFVYIQKIAFREMAHALRRQNRIPDDDLLYYLLFNELEWIVKAPQPALVMQALKRRRLFKQFGQEWRFSEITKGYEYIPLHLLEKKEIDDELLKAPKLKGVTVSSGAIRGKIRIVESYKELHKIKPNDILVAHSTDIAFSPIFPMLSGIVTEVGGIISHGAVVAREYGLPCVIGVTDATKILKDGEEILLDADNGCIVRVSLLDTSS